MNPNVLVSRFALRGLRRLGVLAGLLTVAACCRPTPCGPISFCGTPGAPKPVQVGAEGETKPPGGKFIKIKIINKTQKFIVKKDTTLYSFQYDTDGKEPYCDAVSLSADKPFTKNVPPNSALGVEDVPDPLDKYTCDPADGYAFTITLDIVHMNDAKKTRKITVGCDKSGFDLAQITLDQGTDIDDPAKLTATCNCL